MTDGPPEAGTVAAPVAPPDASSGSRQRRAVLLGAALLVLLSVPLLVTLAARRDTHWYPPGDLAQTELRVRDVWSRHPPLIGLPGRIGSFGADQGSHPGPLSFYALWPAYRLLGASSWAFEASGVLLQIGALAALLWIARRRGGPPLLLGVAAALALLMRYYGTLVTGEPWNPYLPVLAWLVFLLALWSALCGDVALLPVAALAGSFCAQTHIPYAGTTVGLGLFAVAVTFLDARRGRAALPVPARATEGTPDPWRAWVRGASLAAAVSVIVWLPPLVEELTTSPGNLSVIRDHFGDPPEPAIGLRRGLEVTLVNLDPARLLGSDWAGRLPVVDDSVVPGALLVALWAASVVVARRLRHPALLRLDVLLGATLLLSVFSASRIFGTVYPYLVLWAWGVAVLMLLAVGWTGALIVSRHLGDPPRRRPAVAGTAVLVALVLVSTGRFTAAAVDAEVPNRDLEHTLAGLVPAVVDALSEPDAPGGGREGRYLLTWVDPFALNGRGYALLLELERKGFRVGVPPEHRNGARPHRELDPDDATAELHLAIGTDIETWAHRRAEQIAYLDVRTAQEQAEYDQLRTELAGELADAGLEDLIRELDANLFAAIFDDRLSTELRARLERLMALSLDLPTAVFVAPAP